MVEERVAGSKNLKVLAGKWSAWLYVDGAYRDITIGHASDIVVELDYGSVRAPTWRFRRPPAEYIHGEQQTFEWGKTLMAMNPSVDDAWEAAKTYVAMRGAGG